MIMKIHCTVDTVKLVFKNFFSCAHILLGQWGFKIVLNLFCVCKIGFVEESECDTELDGPETCVLESIPVDTKTVSALSTAQTVESCYGILYVLGIVLLLLN